MAYVVTEHCIRCKYMECVEVCPVDCFHEGENMLVIDPEECIDCGVCEGECPVEAILPEDLDEGEHWAPLNAQYSQDWPVITRRKDPPPDAEQFENEPYKHGRFFSAAAGAGD